MKKILVVLALVAIPVTFATVSAEDLTIRQIEQRAHLPGRAAGMKPLYKEVLGGTATKEQKQELLDLYQALAKAKPAKGSQADWEEATTALVTAAREVFHGESEALSKLQAAVNCKDCHAAHRPTYETDGTLVEEAGTFGLAAPPQFVKLANISKDKLTITLYSSEKRAVTSFKEEEVEVDGVIKKEQVPVMQMVAELRASKVSLAYVRLFDATGKEVTGDEVWKRLKPGVTLLRQTDSKEIDPAILKLLSPDALILAPSVLEVPPAGK